MSLLGFLRVLDAIRPALDKASPPKSNRRLELESLERRAVLTLVDSLVTDVQPVETALASVELATSGTLVENAQQVLTADSGGSGSGTGEAEPGDLAIEDPTEGPVLTTGGSASGSGGTSPESSPSSGSGSGTGSEAPSITSLQADRIGPMVWFVGTVTDSDGPVEGLTVYFMVGSDPSIALTATVNADGSFTSIGLSLNVGTLVQAYTIDVDGNQSLLASCYA